MMNNWLQSFCSQTKCLLAVFWFCTVGWSLGDSVREKRQVWRSIDVWRANNETEQEGQ